MVKTTAVQDKVLRLLKRRWRERGSQPNLNEVAGELGMQYMSLKQHLEALDKKGYLTFTSQGRGKPPVIRLVEGPVRLEQHEGVPLLGDIAAGGLHEAVEHCEGFLSLLGRGERFALRVKGDSMSERIDDGDVVILKKLPFKSGDICAVRFEDETTLKYVDVRERRQGYAAAAQPALQPYRGQARGHLCRRSLRRAAARRPSSTSCSRRRRELSAPSLSSNKKDTPSYLGRSGCVLNPKSVLWRSLLRAPYCSTHPPFNVLYIVTEAPCSSARFLSPSRCGAQFGSSPRLRIGRWWRSKRGG